MVDRGTTEPSATDPPLRFAEFFAGIGLVAEALEPLGFETAWANDIEPVKLSIYRNNRPHADRFHLGDVRNVRGSHLPDDLDVATSSFPCIDLSLAGNRKGLAGLQSGMFWEFARVLEEMGSSKPRVVLLENVHGFATSHDGADLRAAIVRLNDLGYSCDVFAIDGHHFVPQSRPRMFVVGLRSVPEQATLGVPELDQTRPSWVVDLYRKNADLRLHALPMPTLPQGPTDLSAVVQRMARTDERWWSDDRLDRFLASLSPLQAQRLESLRTTGRTVWRTAYRRTRNGAAVWEMRRDAIAGCLRTTGGGSSKQALVECSNGEVRVRWMTPLEYARLMGAGSYKLRSGTPNQALFGFGDAVVVDVIRWIGAHYLEVVLGRVEQTVEAVAG